MNPDMNLRIGFRYLKDLLKRFDQDLALALEAYNKGPTLIAAQQDSGSVVKGTLLARRDVRLNAAVSKALTQPTDAARCASDRPLLRRKIPAGISPAGSSASAPP